MDLESRKTIVEPVRKEYNARKRIKTPIEGPVTRDTKLQPCGARRFPQFGNGITLWTHLCSIPFREGTVIHRKAVVVFGHWHNILSASRFEKFYPSAGIPMFGLEIRNEVFVPEF